MVKIDELRHVTRQGIVKKNPRSFTEIHKLAKEYGMTVWKSGGYFYMSGLDARGNHRQGMFYSLKALKSGLDDAISRGVVRKR